MRMKVWGVTDTGLVRKQNQDAYGVDINADTGQAICVVCDGMGGPAGGDIASHIAVDTFLQSVKSNLRSTMGPEQIQEISSFAASLANTAIRQEVQVRSEYRGMGTTLVAAVSYAQGVVVSNVGDSRAYLIQKDLGPEESTLCDGFIVPMEQGDFILLCTDGLVETVTDQQMYDEVHKSQDMEQCLQRLLEISKSNGAADNVTAVLMQKL